MVLSFDTHVLNGLCSDDQMELLDAVDRLRLQGIDHYISLPQIIVCGDQSSGKSSVLEAISGVPFPVKSNLCTRFPTELILRRSAHEDVSVSIVPHEQLSRSDDRLSRFHKKLDGFEGLSELIDSAKVAMGISMQGKSFSKDLLRIEISGPQHPHLTIVDLPGLIHSETKQQSADDVQLVRDVVQAYMTKPRSIILAVISAKNDFANQIVLKLARATDPLGERTMGVITKPDTLVAGSGSESMYNLDSEKTDGSSLLLHRNEEEKKFFSAGVWAQLPSSMLGVAELRKRLSEILLWQIATELPSLIREIDNELLECRRKLALLGDPRATDQEQRLCLLSISERFQAIVHDIKNGDYIDPFFEDAETQEGYEQRLRAVIQHLNREFAKRMKSSGHARTITATGTTTPGGISRDAFVTEVQKLLRRTRGRELPGRFNILIVTDLFLKQSKPWKSIVLKHVDSCWEAARRSLRLVISSIAKNSVETQLLRKVVHPALDKLKEEIASKASELIDSQIVCHPVTYDDQYLKAVHRIKDQRRTEFNTNVVKTFFGVSDLSQSTHIYSNYTLSNLVTKLSVRDEPDEERMAASEAVDCMEAYYSVALKRVIDDVAIEVVERKLMVALSDILSPVAVFEMPEDLVSFIAGESQESRAERLTLSKQLEVLTKGSETCKRFAKVRLGNQFGRALLEEGTTAEASTAPTDEKRMSLKKASKKKSGLSQGSSSQA
ncbi:dynamin family protein [Xylariaceae sp. FL0594]|nr:dynamin family protein [Xylariaceae sp. FL0594]